LLLPQVFFIIYLSKMNIYVSNLSFAIHDEELKEFFAPYGEVTSARIVMDRDSGRSRGFGFVEMTNGPEAAKAIAELDGAVADGRVMKVNEARPREERSGSRPAFNNKRW
jgi:RNA recognition motif-containing protein